jgi:alcohol dehydrogenase
MRAVVFAEPGQVTVSEVPDPGIEGPRDAIVRVLVGAICGTDLHALHGLPGIRPGMVLGHEFVGEVVATGAALTTLAVGDRVVGSDFTACGRCWWCRRGDHWECTERRFFGFGSVFGAPLPGAQAEFVRVPYADTVLGRLPDGCPPEAAIFVGDNLASGYAAAERGGVTPGDTVAVVGGGAVGQMSSLACQAVGAAAVVVVDILPERRALAARHGAITAAPESSRSVVDELTQGRGADVVIDAVGGLRPLQSACDLVRARGTVVSVGAHFDATFPYPVARAFAEELSLRFAIGDGIRLRDRLLALVGAGVIDPTVVVSARVKLDDVPAAYQRLAAHQEVKVLIL